MKQLKLNKKCTPEKMIDFGFKKYGANYKMFVPLYENSGEKMIEAEVLISPTDNYIGYDILDVCNKTLYTAYYDKEFSTNNVVLNSVLTNLAKLFVELNQKEIIEIK